MKKRLRMILAVCGLLIGLLILAGVLFVRFSPQLGAPAAGTEAARIQNSPQHRAGKFQNIEKTEVTTSFSMRTFGYFFGGNTVPNRPIPVDRKDPFLFEKPQDVPLRLTWFGHSAVLLEIDGKKILLDPMLGAVTGPHPWLGSRRFNATLPLSIEQLPPLDAVVISHDHYDHLDYESIVRINGRVNMYFVPLGVGAHLLSWGIGKEKITELDWWERGQCEAIELTAAPARHFSGRGLFNAYSTLWCSWIIRGKTASVFFGGDSGYDHSFKKIGDTYGPFDIAMLECGQYDVQWPEIHMMPEETVQANIDLRSRLLLPIHWGAFKIALHPWDEPVQRLLRQAGKKNVKVTTPMIGESVVPGAIEPVSHWWKQ